MLFYSTVALQVLSGTWATLTMVIQGELIRTTHSAIWAIWAMTSFICATSCPNSFWVSKCARKRTVMSTSLSALDDGRSVLSAYWATSTHQKTLWKEIFCLKLEGIYDFILWWLWIIIWWQEWKEGQTVSMMMMMMMIEMINCGLWRRSCFYAKTDDDYWWH